MAVFDGIRASGQDVRIGSCDLTGRRMYVRVRCEAVQVLAPALLSDYRSPFTGARGADNPVVFAGFVVANSETGCGAATVTPRLELRCQPWYLRPSTPNAAGSQLRTCWPVGSSPMALTMSRLG